MGGSDDGDNIVRLTAREHFVAHQLLIKMHPHNRTLINAITFLAKGAGKRAKAGNSRKYEWLRRKMVEWLKSDERRAAISAAKRGKPNLKLKGVPKTPEHRAAMSAAKRGKPNPNGRGRVWTDEQRAAMSARRKGVPSPAGSLAQKGKPKTEEHKEALRRGWALRKERLKAEAGNP